MFTPENVLSAELINENIIKVTHKDSDNVLITTIQKNPHKEAYKSLIDSGWTLKKIKERTKELQEIEDPNVKRLEVIAGGYSWAISQLNDKRGQLDDIYQEIEEAQRTLSDLYAEQQQASGTLTELYSEQQAASGTLTELYSEQQQASGTLTELYSEQQVATGTLGELYSEQQSASGTLSELYQEQQQASEGLADLYDEHSKATQELDAERTQLKTTFFDKMEEMKQRMQQNYDKYQQLYGMNIFDTIFSEKDNKEVLFKSKLEILAKPQFKNSDKTFKSKIRKTKDINNLIKLVLIELEKIEETEKE